MEAFDMMDSRELKEHINYIRWCRDRGESPHFKNGELAEIIFLMNKEITKLKERVANLEE